MENKALRIAFAAEDGRLRDFTDKATGQTLATDDASSDSPLWKLDLLRDGKSVNLVPGQAKSFAWVRLDPRHPGLRLTWKEFSVEEARGLSVEVVVRLPDASPMSRWTIAVTKPSELALDCIHFPRLPRLVQQVDEELAVPSWLGELVRQPREALCPKPGKSYRRTWEYPGRLSLQCVAWYRRGGLGLYAACDDTSAWRKAFALEGTRDRIGLETAHYPANRATGVAHYELPYSVILGTFQGDWITAAERYRSWAVKQTWARESRLRQGLVPDWVLRTGVWVWNRGRSPGVLEPAAGLQERLGLPVSVFWHWWHGCAYDDGFPEYLPPREGTEAFRKAVARAHNRGLHALVYMNQRLWGTTTRSWSDQGAESFAVRGPDGKIASHVYNVFTQHPCASMCLATPFWRARYAGLAESAHRDLSVDGVYMDQACGYLPCFASDHGHPIGGGRSWIEGFARMAGDIRDRCRLPKPIVLAGEGCGEAWLPYLDLMLTLQVSRERYSPLNDPWEPIPFFPAVYHPYAICYGSYSSLVTPPYDELWPAESAPKEPLSLLDPKFSRQFFLEQARAFVWGQQPAIANFLPSLFAERPEEIAWLMRLARVRSLGLKYLRDGEFLRPPDLGNPGQASSEFSRLSIYAGQKGVVTSYSRQHPLVLAGAWRAADGDVGIALANIGDESIKLSFRLDAKYYGLQEPRHVYRLADTGRHALGPLADPAAVTVNLPAHDASILELSR